MKKIHYYTEEDIEFIRKNIDTMNFNQMAELFSLRYEMKFLGCSIQKVAQRNGIKKTIRVYKDRKNRNVRFDEMTEEKERFIKENFMKYETYQKLADEYNKEFGTNCSPSSINTLCREKYGLTHENIGKFKKGGRSVRLEVGTERIGSGYKICVKVSDKEVPNGDSSNWVQKSRYIYEKYYGEIPNGHMIIHLDGDLENFDIDNLYCISRKISGLFAQNDWWKLDKETKLAAIKWCELNLALKEGNAHANKI